MTMDRKAALMADRRNFLSKVFNRVAVYQIPKYKKIKIIKINLFTYNESGKLLFQFPLGVTSHRNIDVQ